MKQARADASGFPAKAFHKFDVSLPLHVMFTLLSNATCECCPKSTPLHVQFHTDIPHHLKGYALSSFRKVVQSVKYQAGETNYTWACGQAELMDSGVEVLAQISKYGLGHRKMGRAQINRDGGYKYAQGENHGFTTKMEKIIMRVSLRTQRNIFGG